MTVDPYDQNIIISMLEETGKADELRELVPVLVPVTPGKYVDVENHEWLLDENGAWWDQTGVTHDSRYHYLLTAVAPFTQI